jgi:hypothetical protein
LAEPFSHLFLGHKSVYRRGQEPMRCEMGKVQTFL